MNNGNFTIPLPVNEKILQYAPGSLERIELKSELKRQQNLNIEIPLIIGGEYIKSQIVDVLHIPHKHDSTLGLYHKASKEHVLMAVDAAKKAAVSWARTPYEERAAIFLKAAHLLSTKYRYVINAATMLNQSKSVYQAEIDSAVELIDFLRFNSYFMQEVYNQQPMYNSSGTWNRVSYRPLEGFVFAVTPFNFTSIAGNLPTAPALMGNVVVWKPASSSVLSAYYIMELLKEAGLPDGVINFIPGKGSEVGPVILEHKDLAGIHFTGSTKTFSNMWKTVGENLAQGSYRSYPRIVGETGGKDFIFAAPDADEKALSVALFRGAFEYQGQKCSAASRAYIPASIWPNILEMLKSMGEDILMDDITDFRTFMGAVIDKRSFDTINEYISYGKSHDGISLVMGGESFSEKGWFIEPTVFVSSNPKSKLMSEEIFGPVLTVYIYDDDKIEETARLLDDTSKYALTGAIFTKDRYLIETLSEILENAAGNFYINDKPTGAVVGQQPFGGGRGSGTNDKAGSYVNLLRWTSLRTIKENQNPPTNHIYPHMAEN
jgi:1-pyrroline-5-carboxylate dehydrogenase